MAELRFDLVADTKKLVSDIQKALSTKFKIGAKTSGGGAAGDVPSGKEQKKQSSHLAQSVGLLAAIWGLFKNLQPLADALKLSLNLILYWIFKGFKWVFNTLPGLLKETWTKIVDWIKNLWTSFTTWLGTLWESIKQLPSKIWEWVKGLAILVWEKLKEGFNWIVETSKEWIGKLVNRVKDLWNTFKEKIQDLREKLKEYLNTLWNKLKDFWEGLKTKFAEWFESLKEKLQSALDYLKELPQKIWDKLKALGTTIANAVRKAIKNLNPFRSRGGGGGGGPPSTSVGDAIIQPNGRIIKTDPRDTLIATQSGNNLGGGTKIINLYGVTQKEMIDTIRRELRTDVNRAGRF